MMAETVGDIGEFRLIDRLEKLISSEGRKGSLTMLGLGDDAASFIPEQGYEMLVTCDSMIEGRHYIRDCFTPYEIGRRAMVMNISDIGAMGGKPLYALVSLCLNAAMPVEHIEDMYRGFLSQLNPFNASIIGGNITGTDYTPVIDITLIGEVKKSGKVLRSTARAGDSVMVTGYPGQAAAGLKMLLEKKMTAGSTEKSLLESYVRPEHRAFEGHALAMTGNVNAMIDLSDGFLGDLGHICERSGVGAEIYMDKFPLSEDIKKFSASINVDLHAMVLGESDDYELIFTCAPEDREMLKSTVSGSGNTMASEVGRMTNAFKGIRIYKENGEFEIIKPTGWDHFR